MTAPRQLLRGSTYLLTRRCVDRRYRLRPGKLTNQVLGYLLARAAKRTGVRVHAYCAMSNHLHLVVSDPRADLPRFLQDLDSLVARAVNALHAQWGHFWEAGGYNATLLGSAEDVLDRCAYVLANPVAAGLVRKARKWPGLWSQPASVGQPVEFERPAHFFDRNGQLPERLELELSVPRGFASADEFRERLEAALAVREEQAGRERAGFVGVARILRQRVLDRPASRERRRALKPRFAAKDQGRRLALARRLKAFLAEYGEALLAWREGRRDALFPEGTYHMRVMHQAACAGAG
jgi:REP element-mobilizing transposase RayT